MSENKYMINIRNSDYTWDGKGVGYNNYNFIKNVAPRISQWLLKIYNENLSYEEATLYAEKLRKIGEIIDE